MMQEDTGPAVSNNLNFAPLGGVTPDQSDAGLSAVVSRVGPTGGCRAAVRSFLHLHHVHSDSAGSPIRPTPGNGKGRAAYALASLAAQE